ncbi:MAG: hypothetical protein HRT52_07905 [Colwellia sp.]|nr:hypothetical protein [Colwellia sp.]
MSTNNELKSSIRKSADTIASLKEVHIVEQLPKTRSGKILRKTMRQLIDGEDVQIPATIENPKALADLSDILT